MGQRCGSVAAPRLCLPLLTGSDSHEDDEEKTSGVERGPLLREVFGRCRV